MPQVACLDGFELHDHLQLMGLDRLPTRVPRSRNGEVGPKQLRSVGFFGEPNILRSFFVFLVVLYMILAFPKRIPFVGSLEGFRYLSIFIKLTCRDPGEGGVDVFPLFTVFFG